MGRVLFFLYKLSFFQTTNLSWQGYPVRPNYATCDCFSYCSLWIQVGSTGVVSKVQVLKNLKESSPGYQRCLERISTPVRIRIGLLTNPIFGCRPIQALISLSVTGYHAELSAGPLFCSAYKLVGQINNCHTSW